jgi:hypothetical protein
MTLSHRMRCAGVAGLVALTALAASTLPAQPRSLTSVVAGATFASLRGVDDAQLDQRTGLMAGLSHVRPLAGALALQPELLVVGKGAEQATPVVGTSRGLDLTYLEMPILLRLAIARDAVLNPHLYAGPYLGLRIRCRIEGRGGDCDDLDGISTRTVDVGGIAGAGVSVQSGRLVLTGGARYGFGASSIADFDLDGARESARNGFFALYVGVGVRSGR